MSEMKEISSRLYYLDWLCLILIFGVYLYQVVKPFDPLLDWYISNPERSNTIMSVLFLINTWGLPLFFLVAGAARMFALRRRSNCQYIIERTNRLLIPCIVGTILLTPFQKYLVALHNGSKPGAFLPFFSTLVVELVRKHWFKY